MGKVFMLVSSPRSGSNFLSSLVRESEEIDVLIEPFSHFLRDRSALEFQRWDEHDYRPFWYHRCAVGDDRARRRLDDFRAWTRVAGRPHVRFFKETCVTLKLRWFLSFVPELRVLFLIRDPAEIVSSFLRNRLVEKWRYRAKLVRLGAESPIPPAEAQSTPAWRLAALVLRWRLESMLAFAQDHGERVSWVRYEDLAGNPLEPIRLLFTHLETSMTRRLEREIAEKMSGERGDLYSTFRAYDHVAARKRGYQLSERQRTVTDTICGPVYERLCGLASNRIPVPMEASDR